MKTEKRHEPRMGQLVYVTMLNTHTKAGGCYAAVHERYFQSASENWCNEGEHWLVTERKRAGSLVALRPDRVFDNKIDADNALRKMIEDKIDQLEDILDKLPEEQ
jgi:hypothetical protein